MTMVKIVELTVVIAAMTKNEMITRLPMLILKRILAKIVVKKSKKMMMLLLLLSSFLGLAMLLSFARRLLRLI